GKIMKFKKLFLSLVFTLLFISPSVFAAPTKCAKVAIIGDFASGKTAIYKSIIGEDYIEEDKINTRNYRKEDVYEIVNGVVLSIRLLDTPGLSDYREEVINSLGNSNLVYIVVDTVKEYDRDAANYLRDIARNIRERVPNSKVVFLFTKYDLVDDFIDIAMPNAANMRSLKEMNKECYFTSSIPNFMCAEQNFIHARDVKQHMINYLTQHIEELPERHEPTIIQSDWKIADDLRQKDEIINQREEKIRQKD
ncbi:MAG: GTPase domain-containing protein, partial [Clostridia bacterium]|nr:GTPase domain-containing protein [Clostridia bacterium]